MSGTRTHLIESKPIKNDDTSRYLNNPEDRKPFIITIDKDGKCYNHQGELLITEYILFVRDKDGIFYGLPDGCDYNKYDLVTMSDLPDSDPDQAKINTIYLSETGDYIVRDTEGDVQQGNINDKNDGNDENDENDEKIDLQNLESKLNDRQFKASVLKVTSKAGHTQHEYHHSYFVAGQPVKAAGFIKTNNQGVMQVISNNSGHYKPTLEESMYILQYLYQTLSNDCLDNLEFEDHSKMKEKIIRTFNLGIQNFFDQTTGKFKFEKSRLESFIKETYILNGTNLIQKEKFPQEIFSEDSDDFEKKFKENQSSEDKENQETSEDSDHFDFTTKEQEEYETQTAYLEGDEGQPTIKYSSRYLGTTSRIQPSPKVLPKTDMSSKEKQTNNSNNLFHQQTIFNDTNKKDPFVFSPQQNTKMSI